MTKMGKHVIGLEVLSRIFIPNAVELDNGNEILIDIENHISEYVHKKYDGIVGGNGRLYHNKDEVYGNQYGYGCEYCNTNLIKSMIGYKYMNYCPRCGTKIDEGHERK